MHFNKKGSIFILTFARKYWKYPLILQKFELHLITLRGSVEDQHNPNIFFTIFRNFPNIEGVQLLQIFFCIGASSFASSPPPSVPFPFLDALLTCQNKSRSKIYRPVKICKEVLILSAICPGKYFYLLCTF